MSVPQQIQDIKGCLISPVDIFQIAGVIGWVGFLLVLIFMQKFRYLCLTKSIVLPFSGPSSGNNWAQNKLIPRAFSVIPLFFSGNSLHYWCHFPGYHKLLPNFGNASWLSRICLGIWANQTLRIAKKVFLNYINKTNSLFSVTSLSR